MDGETLCFKPSTQMQNHHYVVEVMRSENLPGSTHLQVDGVVDDLLDLLNLPKPNPT